MLHPSPLPLYRGISPIQNQIINGEIRSKVTIFVMNNEVDSGDIVGFLEYSLDGTLEQILNRITECGIKITLDILKNGIVRTPQDHSKATYLKRRTPDDSEITIDELQSSSSLYLYNKIRMLADPYPNAFIKTSDGRKLIIKEVEIID